MKGHVAGRQFVDNGGLLTLPILYHNEFDAGLKAASLADQAAKATEAAAAARAAAANDPSKAQASIDAELARQTAVNAYIAAGKDVAEAKAEINDMMEILKEVEHEDASVRRQRIETARSEIGALRAQRAAAGGADAAPSNSDLANLSLVNISTQSKTDNKGAFIQVTGQIHNPRSRPVLMPAISVAALDRSGLKLSGFVAEPDGKQTIPPGSDIGFSYAFRPSPQRAVSFSVTFAKDDSAPMLTDSYFCR
jgi:hypothetical protein